MTGPQEDAQHVVDTVLVVVLLPVVLAVGIHPVLLHVCSGAGIGIEHLVHPVAVAFKGSLPKIQRGHFLRDIAKQRVAHDKDLVGPTVATRGETGPIGLVSFIGGVDDRHAGRAGFQPHKLPIIIKVISQVFPTREGCVAECTLCTGPWRKRQKHA